MKDGDATPIFLGVAALAVALWLHMKNSELQAQLNDCRSQFQGFKDGVIYGR
jgi:hypothetical protein